MCVCWCGSVGRLSKRTIKLWSKSVFACLNKGCILFPGRGDFSSTLGFDQMTKRVQKTRLVRQEGIIFTVDGQTCETEDACRQNCALCLCEIMRTSTSGQTLFVINGFFFMCQVTWLGKEAAFNHREAEIMEWWGNWNMLNCFLVYGWARTKEKLWAGRFSDLSDRLSACCAVIMFMSIHGANLKNPIWRSKQWNFHWQAADRQFIARGQW